MGIISRRFAFKMVIILSILASGCGRNSNDALLDEYEKLCLKSASIQSKIRGNDLSSMKELESLNRDILKITSKLDSLKENELTSSQRDRLMKILAKCAGS